MKKTFSFLIIFFTTLLCFAENVQLLLPKNVYTGEVAELQYIFQSKENLIPVLNTKDDESDSLNHLDLDTDFSVFRQLESRCKVVSASIEFSKSFSGENYTLSIDFIPWQPGTIDFPAFDLCSLIRFSCSPQDYTPNFTVNFDPFDVYSIVDEKNITLFRNVAPPHLIPGTKTLIVIFLVLTFVFLFALVNVLVRIPAISRAIRDMQDSRTLRRNARISIRNLNRLKMNSANLDDEKFALALQKIIREFIASRFEFDFKSVVTSEITRIFDMRFGDLLTEKAANAVDMLQSIFLRTDYIRFAHGQHDAAFRENEKEGIINAAIQMVRDFDFDPETLQEGEE